MNLTQIIEEQSTFGFTGRINVQNASNGQYLGLILQKEGSLVHAEYNGISGEKALFHLLVHEQRHDKNFKFMVEPEIISDQLQSFSLSWIEFYEKGKTLLQENLEANRLKPPGNLRLMVQSEFISQGASINQIEFQVLRLISDHNKVSKIYEIASLHDFEITHALVSLRKKGAIKVLG